MQLPTTLINQLIDGVFSGEITLKDLPEWLYVFTTEILDSAFLIGFGHIDYGDIPLAEKAVAYRQNIGRFSGAKTFSEVKSLTDYVFTEDGKKRPFAEFKKKALKINNAYDVNYLRTEQNTVVAQAQNARKWVKYEQQKELFPYLQYVTTKDGRVRPSHAKLDGLIASVDDPIWNRIMPQNEWGCRCTVLQLHESKPTTKAEIDKKTKPLFTEFKKNSEFNYNPGKVDYIFKEKGKGKSSYFKVPRNFSEDLKKNFGFPSVEEVTGKEI